MPLVHPTHVVSFSSEDPHHPASNLLNRETYRKWKCKEPGEKEAFVILKFDKAVSINGIDIGNDGSALIEVSVARSGSGGEPEYEVILSSTAFMSPGDAREGKNLNGVRNFSLNSLCKPIAAEKWDLVKVSVSQPFNRHVQYGLTFVKFVAPADPDEPKKIGIFGFKTNTAGSKDSDSDEDFRPGRLFQPKKAQASSSVRDTNQEIMATSKKLSDASKASSDAFVEELLRVSKPATPSASISNGSGKARAKKDPNTPLLSRRQLEDPPLSSKKDKETPNSNSSPVPSPSNSKVSSSSASPSVSKKRQHSPPPPSSSSGKPSSSSSTSAKKPKKAKKTAPFNKLFDGVVFAMSGFQNPLRGEIRDKAIQMGAKYKADWDRSCTHLICAFYNTPKFREVRAANCGQIVKQEWIDESYRNKIRFPWRRYCLDRADRGQESEDEVYSEPIAGRGDEEEVMDEDDEPEEKNEEEKEEAKKPKRKRVFVMESSDEEKSNDSAGAYNANTDVDDDDDRTPDLSPSMLSSNVNENDDEENETVLTTSIFKDFGFYIYLDDNSESSSKIKKIIKNNKGKVFNTPTDEVEFYICHSYEWMDDFSDALSDNPNLIFIYQDWIIECDKKNKMVDKDKFLLSPQ